MKKIFLSIVFLVFCVTYGKANLLSQQDGYCINIQFTGIYKGAKIYLEKCVNSAYLAIDSTFTDKEGKFAFSGTTPLQSGVYSLSPADNKNVSLGIFITDEASQHFSISYDVVQGLSTFKVEGSPENQFFAECSYFTYLQQVAIYDLQEEMKTFVRTHDQETGIDSLWKMQFRLDNLSNSIVEKWNEGIAKFKGSTLALFYQSIQTPLAPEPEFSQQITDIDSVYQAYYAEFYKYHYFDNIDFSDARILRTSVLIDMMDSYFQQILPFDMEAMKEGCDILFNKARDNREVYEFVLKNRYEFFLLAPPEIQEIPLFIAKKYIENKTAEFTDIAFVSRVEYWLKMTDLNPVGSPITDIALQNVSGNNFSIYDVEAPYTVVIFHSPDCHACTIITPMLWDVYTKYKDKGLKVVALYLDTDKELWTSYITENGYDWINVWKPEDHAQLRQSFNITHTPIIYLLDKNKNIIRKDILVDALDIELEILL